MKNHLFISLLLAASLLLSSCGTAAPTPAPAMPTNPPASQPTQSANPPAETLAPTQPPAPVPTDASGSGPVEVQITLGDNWIKSSMTTFKVGVTYRFVITNTGRRKHMLDISHPAEMNTSAIRQAMMDSILSVPETQLGAGAQVTVDFTFKDPAPAGTLEFACHIERHYKDGQFLGIVVE